MGRHRERITKTCIQCGNEFERTPSAIKQGGGKFCSISCATTYRNKTNNPTRSEEVRKKISENHADVSGKNNPMYGVRGKDAPSYIDGRSSFSGGPYRRKLLASGKEQKCTICGTTEQLHAHHLNGNHKDNRIENLSWLCARCHNNKAHEYKRDKNGRFIGSALRNIKE